MGIDYNKRPSGGQPGAGQQAGGAPVSLSKVTLTKSAPTVSLTKQGSVGGTMRVNLNWNARPAQQPASGGFFKRAMGGGGGVSIDLDLGCLYEFSDGTKGAVQALGNAFRDRNQFGPSPIIRLDGDDRSGTNQDGENLFIDLSDVSKIRRIMVYAFIYEGVANWAAADGVVTLFPVSGPQIEVRLDEHAANSGMCGIAMLENVNGELSVRREVRYVSGHRDLDRAYGWGMNWTAGSK
jgi:tellurite resistance protein TerA